MNLKYFCQKCEMKISKKEIKRHQKLNHTVIEIAKQSQKQKPFVDQVLDDLRKNG